MRLRTSRERSRAEPGNAGRAPAPSISSAMPASRAVVLEAFGLLADEGVQPDGFAEFASGFQPREVEQVGDDAGQAQRFALELRGEPGHGRGVLVGDGAQRLGRRLDRGGGGLQLVGRVGDEVAAHRLGRAASR